MELSLGMVVVKPGVGVFLYLFIVLGHGVVKLFGERFPVGDELVAGPGLLGAVALDDHLDSGNELVAVIL